MNDFHRSNKMNNLLYILIGLLALAALVIVILDKSEPPELDLTSIFDDREDVLGMLNNEENKFYLLGFSWDTSLREIGIFFNDEYPGFDKFIYNSIVMRIAYIKIFKADTVIDILQEDGKVNEVLFSFSSVPFDDRSETFYKLIQKKLIKQFGTPTNNREIAEYLKSSWEESNDYVPSYETVKVSIWKLSDGTIIDHSILKQGDAYDHYLSFYAPKYFDDKIKTK